MVILWNEKNACIMDEFIYVYNTPNGGLFGDFILMNNFSGTELVAIPWSVQYSTIP